MDPIPIGLIAFSLMLSGALLGIFGRGVVPAVHLDADSRDIMKLAISLIATMTALVLGLLISSARISFDTTTTSVRSTAATLIVLDRVLGRYGAEAGEVRHLLHRAITQRMDSIWPEDKAQSAKLDDPDMALAFEALEDKIHRLVPQDDHQRWLQSRALEATNELLQVRWLLQESGSGIPSSPFLVALIFWLTFIFATFGLMAPRNSTVIGVLTISALSVAISIVLVLEMEHPFAGLIKVSSAPIRFMISHLGQ